MSDTDDALMEECPGWVLRLIMRELRRARELHPDWPAGDHVHAACIVGEEAGELLKAANQYKYEGGSAEDCDEEAVHTAATAIRFLMER